MSADDEPSATAPRPRRAAGAPLPISGLGAAVEAEGGRDATDVVDVDPFAAPQATDVSLQSPFAPPPGADRTVAEPELPGADAPATVASGPAAAGAPFEEPLTAVGGHAVDRPSRSALGTSLTLYDGNLDISDDSALSDSALSHRALSDSALSSSALSDAAEASPVPEISQTGEPIADVDDDDDPPTRPVRRGRAAGHAMPVEFMLGGYQAHRRLGMGGMAEVFLARPPGGTRDVVLKRLMAHLSDDPRVGAMFRREARIASRLDHPNIVHILDFAEEHGSMFLVMEHLEGSDFRDLAYRWWATSRPLPIEPVVELIADVALGLDYAHHAEKDDGPGASAPRKGRPGLVHRDISPENLFLTREGVAKILDFGIAKPEGENDHLTRTGEVKGKIPYMSPEQVHGEPLDGRSDLWSLAVVLYWLLTGHRPFDGPNDFMTIKQIMEADPVPPAAVNDLVPAALDGVVLRSLAKDPSQRFSRGRDLHDELVSLIGRLDRKLEKARFAAEVGALEIPPVEPVPYHPAAVPFARWPSA